MKKVMRQNTSIVCFHFPDQMVVRCCMYDIFCSRSLIKKSFRERRELLHKHFKHVDGMFHFAEARDALGEEAIATALNESVQGIFGIFVTT